MPQKTDDRPETVGMQIHTGMLESLGINMYTSIGKSLVEFIANGFDAEASEVNLSIPFGEIAQARKELREQVNKRKDQDNENGSNYEVLSSQTLPEEIEIVVSDDGHGMTVQDIENKFLSINRNRREESKLSEGGLRRVMGRKGLGKLAGFGVSQVVAVRSKREGETYATTIVMDYNEIERMTTMEDVVFRTQYEEGLDPTEKSTTITLKRLRYNSLKSKPETIKSTLARNFYITGDDFTIRLNGETIEAPEIDYEFTYPDQKHRTAEGELAEAEVSVDGEWGYPIHYAVYFRARGKDGDGKLRGHLPARLRGARVYCNQRLAAGPTLFDLETGMHNFHAQSYMECVVRADVLDDQEADLIGTNRSNLKTDNEIVDAFIVTVTQLMKEAIAAHGRYREQVVEEEMSKDPTTQTILQSTSTLPKKHRRPVRQLLETLAANTDGVDSEAYQEVAPFLVKAVNSTEVIKDLIKSGVNPTSLPEVIDQLYELSSVERSDVLKLYRARRHGIDALRILEERSNEGRGTNQYEGELHDLLKMNPWLIKPEYSSYLTSDQPQGEVAKKLNTQLKIDECARLESAERPDLVFVATMPHVVSHVMIVELKSPNVPLRMEHINQLDLYISQIEDYLFDTYQREVRVTGHLIGNVPPVNSKIKGNSLFKKELRSAGADSQREIITLPKLLERARTVHLAVIKALEAEEARDDLAP